MILSNWLVENMISNITLYGMLL